MPYDETEGGRIKPFAHIFDAVEAAGWEMGEAMAKAYWENEITPSDREKVLDVIETQSERRRFESIEKLIEMPEPDDDDVDDAIGGELEDAKDDYPDRVEELEEMFDEQLEGGFYNTLIELAEAEGPSEVEDGDEDDDE